MYIWEVSSSSAGFKQATSLSQKCWLCWIKFQTIITQCDPDSLNSFHFYTEPSKILTPQGIVILFASPRLSDDCEQKVKAMESLDICSPKFSFSRAVEAVKREGARMLCDVLLDQAILPGVGNIIKNEALFDSGLNPAVKVQFTMWSTDTKLSISLLDVTVEWMFYTLFKILLEYYLLIISSALLKVKQLTSEQVHHLVKMTRDFTLLFYKVFFSLSIILNNKFVILCFLSDLLSIFISALSKTV